MRAKMRAFFVDRIAMAFTVGGIALMAVALHYNVNPVCCGALRGGIENHPAVLWALLLTTLPAMLFGSLLPAIPDPDIAARWVYFLSIFACQGVLFFALGKAAGGCLKLLRRKRRVGAGMDRGEAEP